MDAFAYKKLGIALEVVAFFLVAPEFLGPSRLRSLGDNAKTLLTVPLDKLQALKTKLHEKFADNLYWPLMIIRIGSTLGALSFAFVFALGLYRFHVGMNWLSFVLLWLVAIFFFLLAVVLGLPVLSMPSVYVVVSLIVRICSGTLHTLAESDRLRLWVFWAGAMFFFAGKAIEWIFL